MRPDAPTCRSLVQGLGAAFAVMLGVRAATGQSRITRFQPTRRPQG
jgi:hypothetical protein